MFLIYITYFWKSQGLKESKIIDFGEDECEFYANVNDAEDRFILHFVLSQKIENNNTSMNSIEDNENKEETVDIYSIRNIVNITIDVEEATLTIFDIEGKEIINNVITNGINKINVDAVSGYYIVNVKNEKINYSEKVFIE